MGQDSDKEGVRALSIRQPYAELIRSTAITAGLRGIKTVEYQSRATAIIGERFHHLRAAAAALAARASEPTKRALG
jgi:hypothetical protein